MSHRGVFIAFAVVAIGVADPWGAYASATSVGEGSGMIRVEGASLYYELAGAGPEVVLLHAGVADSRMWDEQFEYLAKSYSVVRFDFRGFGRSEVGGGAFTDFDDVAAVMDAVGFEKAVVIGLSFGARVAVDFVLVHPSRVRALILSGPMVGGFRGGEDLSRFSDAEAAALERGDLQQAVEINLRTWVDGVGRDSAAVKKTVRDRVAQMQRLAFEKEVPDDAVGNSLEPAAIGRLGEITVPVLVIVGTSDLPSVVSHAKWIVSEMSSATLATLPAAHMTNMECSDEFNALVIEFLSKTSGLDGETSGRVE